MLSSADARPCVAWSSFASVFSAARRAATVGTSGAAAFFGVSAATARIAAKTDETLGCMGGAGSGGAVYCGTKHFLEGLSAALRLEVAGQGVRVSTVQPTLVDTPLVTANLAGTDVAAVEERRAAMELGERFIRESGLPRHTALTRVAQGGEPGDFTSLFKEGVTW